MTGTWTQMRGFGTNGALKVTGEFIRWDRKRQPEIPELVRCHKVKYPQLFLWDYCSLRENPLPVFSSRHTQTENHFFRFRESMSFVSSNQYIKYYGKLQSTLKMSLFESSTTLKIIFQPAAFPQLSCGISFPLNSGHVGD